MSHMHRELRRSVRMARKLSDNPTWVGDVVISALKRIGLTPAEYRAVADAAAAAAKVRMRVVVDATRSAQRSIMPSLGADAIDGGEGIDADRKTAAAGDR